MAELKNSWDVHAADDVGVAVAIPMSPGAAAEAETARRDAEDRAQARQDRDDLAREMSGQDTRMRRFIFDRNDPRTREGRDRRREEARSRTSLLTGAAWDAQKVVIGGVEMTNGEAQASRRRVLENQDYWGRWARERGLIRAGQEGQLFATIREEHDLKEHERNGTLTPGRAQRLREIENSEMGRAGQAVVGRAHEVYALSASRESFPGSPLPRSAFSEAAQPAGPAAAKAPTESTEPPVPGRPHRPVAASGLDL